MSSLHQATIDHLSRFAPFDRMADEHKAWLAERLKIGYYGNGEAVLAPDRGEVDRLYIIKQGIVQGQRDGAGAWLELHEGESFPIGALLAHRAAISTFRAHGDLFCYELAASDFHQLLVMSAPFHGFCTLRLADLLAQSQRQTQARYASAIAERQSLETPLFEIVRRAPLSCGPDTPLRQALEAMQDQSVGSIVVVDAEQRPLGIFTVRDLIGRVILPGITLDTPIAERMTPQPVALPAEALASEAALAMARHGFRHILVVDKARLVGVVSERDLFSLQRIGVSQLSETLRHAQSLAALQAAAADIRELGHNMLAQGVGAEQLTQLLSTLNDLLTRRVIELELAASGLGGAYCWLAFGSEGRLEQTLSTDQDNGLIITPAPGEDLAAARARWLDLARRVNQSLDACGFPLCKGGIMAMNPKWCLTLAEWQATFGAWIVAGDPEALLHATIFFDFRALAGDSALAETLREGLLRRTTGANRFQHQLAANALLNSPPLGLVRDFVVASGGDQADTLDLKVNGAAPFVDAARLLALAEGIAATGTATRLRAAGTRHGIPQAEIEAWIAAFYFIQSLRLRRQHERHEEAAASPAVATNGRGSDNRINPYRLNDLDRRILKESFRQARKLQARLAQDYHL